MDMHRRANFVEDQQIGMLDGKRRRGEYEDVAKARPASPHRSPKVVRSRATDRGSEPTGPSIYGKPSAEAIARRFKKPATSTTPVPAPVIVTAPAVKVEVKLQPQTEPTPVPAPKPLKAWERDWGAETLRQVLERNSVPREESLRQMRTFCPAAEDEVWEEPMIEDIVPTPAPKPEPLKLDGLKERFSGQAASKSPSKGLISVAKTSVGSPGQRSRSDSRKEKFTRRLEERIEKLLERAHDLHHLTVEHGISVLAKFDLGHLKSVSALQLEIRTRVADRGDVKRAELSELERLVSQLRPFSDRLKTRDTMVAAAK